MAVSAKTSQKRVRGSNENLKSSLKLPPNKRFSFEKKITINNIKSTLRTIAACMLEVENDSKNFFTRISSKKPTIIREKITCLYNGFKIR